MARQSTRVANATTAKAEKAADESKATKPAPKKNTKATSTAAKPKANTAAKRATPAAANKDKKTKETKETVAKKQPAKAATSTAKRGRPKKTETPEPAPMRTTKRKAAEETDDEAAPAKKTKTKAKAAPKPKASPKKAKAAPKPKAPPKPKIKTVINELLYTDPLKVFVFGEGSSGELGLGTASNVIDVKRPRLNPLLSPEQVGVVRVAAGGMHAIALTKDNKILTWGVNDNGALGRDTTNEDEKMRDIDDEGSDSGSDDSDSGLNPKEATPTQVNTESLPEGTTFVDVVAGDSMSFALTDDGLVYGWGTFRKNEGVLGFTEDVDTARVPILITGIKKVTKIAAGANHVLALDKDGHVWAWGSGQQNQLGRRLTERALLTALTPTRVGFHDSNFKRPSAKMVDIYTGEYHSFFRGQDGHIWACGVNNYGETGLSEGAGEDNAAIVTPRIVASLEGLEVVHIKGGSHHNVAITASGEVLVWGRCDANQTGLQLDRLSADDVIKNDAGKAKILITPTVLPSIKDAVFSATGPDHCIVLTKEGKAYSWGFSTNYQTGLGTDEDVEVPTVIENTAVREEKVIFAGCGGQFSILASKA